MERELARAYIITDGEGIVRNIGMYTNPEDANRVARCVYGDSAAAGEYRWLVSEGDRYRGGVYYTVDGGGNESPAQYIPTEQESIEQLKGENAGLKAEAAALRAASDMLTLAVADMIGGAV